MFAFDKIAERRIEEAMRQGAFDNLPGKGKPLQLEDFSLVPEDLRLAYKVLKNAGYLPPELELKKEVFGLRELLDRIDDDALRLKKIRELNFKIMKLRELLARPVYLEEYEDKLTGKIIG
jgi:hypothetical protein